MRTKSLILSAAVLAAGVASSMAANVYSVNVVGYVTLNLTNGFNMIANPLDAIGGGTGTGNTVANVFGVVPNNTTVYKFSGGTYSSDVYITGIGWLGGGTATFNPGEGLFVQIPNGIPGNSTNVTFAGTVVQGPTTHSLPTGFSIASSQAPISGALTANLGYQPHNNDTVYPWNPASQSYPVSYVYITGLGWLPSDPILNVGQSVFIQNNGGSPNVWTNTFTVN